MEERRKYQQDKINEVSDNFVESKSIPRYLSYVAVPKFRSIRRAIRRGHVDLFTGIIYPKRPFNNRKPTLGRDMNEKKKQIYEQYIH